MMFAFFGSELFVFFLHTILGGLLAYFAVIYTSSRKSRIDEYDELLEKLSISVEKLNDLSIEYWSLEGQNYLLEGQMKNSYKECRRLIKLLASKQCQFFQHTDIKKKIKRYFKRVTSGGFAEPNRARSENKINTAVELSSDLRNSIYASKFPLDFKQKILARIK